MYDAAMFVGISKRSLDDYYMQLRYGMLFCFDFKAHEHSRFGVLRQFNNRSRQIYYEKYN